MRVAKHAWRRRVVCASVLSWATVVVWSLGTGAAESAGESQEPAARFEVHWPASEPRTPQEGRLFLILSRTNQPEPRFALGENKPGAPIVLARDVDGFGPGNTLMLDERGFVFPSPNALAHLQGDYFLQALFDSNRDLRSPYAPGNRYSIPRKIRLPFTGENSTPLLLTESIPAETLPEESAYLKYVRLQSALLTKFYGRPIYLRAGIILPKGFAHESDRRYPLWIQIGGLNTRYWRVGNLMSEGSNFRSVWLSEKTPRFLMLHLDGAGPNGDPYQVNSENNGPYGDAVVQELIPFVESKFRGAGTPKSRVLSGTSTGGWVCLALQIFYPDVFNGAWSSCPDPVDFRALELLDIYREPNAYVDAQGKERLSQRTVDGTAVMTMRQEVAVENLLGRGNRYVLSGEQWGEWNCVFGPRGKDGLPKPLWDPQSGQMDFEVAEHWKRYDLSLVLKQNWETLEPKLRNKLHLAAGEADQYFLNQAVHLLEQRMAKSQPSFNAKIVYGPGQGHGWMDLTLAEMLEEMAIATRTP